MSLIRSARSASSRARNVRYVPIVLGTFERYDGNDDEEQRGGKNGASLQKGLMCVDARVNVLTLYKAPIPSLRRINAPPLRGHDG